MGDEVDFLAADKHKSFLHVDNIAPGVHSQACPKYPIVYFLPADKRQRFLPSDTIILGVSGQACPNYPK